MAQQTISTPNIRRDRLRARLLRHHLPLLLASVFSVFLLDTTRPYADWITRLSFSSGYAALVLLAATLWLGPWNVLRRRRVPVSDDLRRDVGIWAGVLGLLHTGIGLCVHMRGRPWLYFVYSRSEGHHAIPLRHDLFGFANDTGLFGSLILLLLFATSNDLSLRRLHTAQWKSLQRWNYLLFALAAAHTWAYQRMEKQTALFLATLWICAALTLLLQGLGYRQRRREHSTRTRIPGRA